MSINYDFTSAPKSPSRHWMGVVYNPNVPTRHHGMGGYSFFGDCMDDAFEERLGKELKYYCRGTENCPTTGTEHLQCYFIFKEKLSLSSIRKKFETWFGFPCTVAFEQADNNCKACIEYCGKEKNEFVEGGQQPPGAGKRTDLDSVILAVQGGADILEIANKHPSVFIKCGGGISKWIAQIAKPRDHKTEVFWVHGPTGTGKSRWVMDNVDREDLYLKSGSTKWWCGYANQKTILWDDFRPSKDVPFEFLLRLLDRFPLQVEGKGTVMNFAPHRIFITTPQNPQETFRHWEFLGQENMEQLNRRITRIVSFDHLQLLGIPAPPGEFIMEMNQWTPKVIKNVTNMTEQKIDEINVE